MAAFKVTSRLCDGYVATRSASPRFDHNVPWTDILANKDLWFIQRQTQPPAAQLPFSTNITVLKILKNRHRDYSACDAENDLTTGSQMSLFSITFLNACMSQDAMPPLLDLVQRLEEFTLDGVEGLFIQPAADSREGQESVRL
ncbi:hypothetical protein BGZ83_002041 [Gryganskiella cystojenkinii]|nr:hypothetical protein BGZ83_002041 [Gryganskiella cystojenkinii]